MSKPRKAFYWLLKILFTFAFTGGVYLLLESLWRGYTFLEMYYLAGFLGLITLAINEFFLEYDNEFLLQVLFCTVIGTLAEGICGYLYNYDYHIWDYRKLPGTFFNGQCNIFFAFAWFVVFFFLIPILDYIDWKVFKYKEDTPPYYVFFGKKVFQFKD